MTFMSDFVIGVDEAGRGPLAGPVAIGVVLVPANYNLKKNFPDLDDSKKLSPRRRESIYIKLKAVEHEHALRHVVVFSSAHTIDSIGITRAVKRAVWSGIRKLAPEPGEVRVFLDGLLTAPPEYLQETIIHGDSLVPAISLASVVAKVTRDRLMCRTAQKFPRYGFEIHKGYGTALHRDAIEHFGLCAAHRRSFIHREFVDESAL
jgi:ribonuclease HII